MKVAIIGRGFGQNVMAPGFKSIGWDVEIVPSRDAAGVAAALAQPFDLIAVHSPPFQHREHVLAAIAAGRAVLCDKPFGANAAQAREMRDAAKAAGVLHFLNFEFRTQPARVRAKELVESGAIGTLTHISHSSFGNGFRQRPHGWLHDSGQAGGWIGAWGSHAVDSLRFAFDGSSSDADREKLDRRAPPERERARRPALATRWSRTFPPWLASCPNCAGYRKNTSANLLLF